MPLYSYICENCGKRDRRFLPVSRYKEPQECQTPGCHSGKPMTKIIEAPAVVGDYEGYLSPATGKWVEGRKQHQEDLARSNCRILEPGESRMEMEKTRNRQAAAEKSIDEAVERTAAELGITQ